MSTFLFRSIVLGALIVVALVGVVLWSIVADDGSTASYRAAAVWSNESGQVTSAVRSCVEGRRSSPSCLVEGMVAAGASRESIAFYQERGLVLTDFKAFGRHAVGRALDPFTNLGPMWVVLNGPSGFLLIDDLLVRLDLNSGADRTYDDLLLARTKARPASEGRAARCMSRMWDWSRR
jgi:hypothetical protein